MHDMTLMKLSPSTGSSAVGLSARDVTYTAGLVLTRFSHRVILQETMFQSVIPLLDCRNV